MPPTKEDLERLRHEPIKKEEKVTNIWGEEEYQQNPQYTNPNKTHHNYNPKHFQMFGENKIALAQELRDYHPELTALIQEKHGMDYHLALAEIAAYCEVILKGEYTEEELEKLAGILKQKLMLERLDFVFSPATDILADIKDSKDD